MTWSEQAEDLLINITETGLTAAGIVAAAWRAGVDPAATDGLTGAALWMHAEPKDLLTGGLVPVPSDREMITQAADVATDTGTHASCARTLAGQVEHALNAAIRAAEAASARVRAAKDNAEARVAAEEERRALAEIADCEYALEILVTTITRLNAAIDCLDRVPDDLLTTYELAYEHKRRGGTLPFRGDFLTGVPA